MRVFGIIFILVSLQLFGCARSAPTRNTPPPAKMQLSGHPENLPPPERTPSITPIFPEGEELQKCIGSIFFVVTKNQERPWNMIPFAICFRNNTTTFIDHELSNGLKTFGRILAKNSDNTLMLIIPDEIRDKHLAKTRINAVKNFLLREKTNPAQIIILEDRPPE